MPDNQRTVDDVTCSYPTLQKTGQCCGQSPCQLMTHRPCDAEGGCWDRATCGNCEQPAPTAMLYDEITRLTAIITQQQADLRTLAGAVRVPTRHWRHKKRGTVYAEVCRAELQAATYDPKEGEWMVVYQDGYGITWVRAAGEFNDGRFEEVPPDPTRDAAIAAAVGRALNA